MIEKETWRDIQDFPGYAVSDLGRVMNLRTETIKVPTVNQQGIPSVSLIRDRIQHRRSLSILVAEEFCVRDRSTFDTPINLDGDRTNNRADNLMWRPRWFARRYHTQLKMPIAFGCEGSVEVLDTGEVFDDVRACAMYYGLLEKEIILGAHNSQPVFPIWYTFRIV